jgi:hypothetical protein
MIGSLESSSQANSVNRPGVHFHCDPMFPVAWPKNLLPQKAVSGMLHRNTHDPQVSCGPSWGGILS